MANFKESLMQAASDGVVTPDRMGGTEVNVAVEEDPFESVEEITLETETTSSIDLDDIFVEEKKEEVVLETVPELEIEPEPVEFKPEPKAPTFIPAPKRINKPKNSRDLPDKLVQLAKAVVLRDITENFTSELITKSAIEQCVNSYLEGDMDAQKKSMLSIALGEAISNGYTEDSYNELTAEILEDIREELK